MTKDNKSVEKLKNALLSLLLLTTLNSDIDKQFDYSKYNGTKLPPASGVSIQNACLSYIIDKDEFKTNPYYSKQMDEKLNAINKYIKKKLNSDKKIIKLFDIFVKKYIEK